MERKSSNRWVPHIYELVFKIGSICSDFKNENFKNFQGIFSPDPLGFARSSWVPPKHFAQLRYWTVCTFFNIVTTEAGRHALPHMEVTHLLSHTSNYNSTVTEKSLKVLVSNKCHIKNYLCNMYMKYLVVSVPKICLQRSRLKNVNIYGFRILFELFSKYLETFGDFLEIFRAFIKSFSKAV